MALEALVGRGHESAVLFDLVERALAGAGGTALVTGEAGIGKSALVSHIVARARSRGARVLVGTCAEGAGAPGYWPWTQVVRDLATELGPQAWHPLRDGLPALARLWIDLGMGGPLADRFEDVGPDAFALHDAILQALVRSARMMPLVIVLEDLQWADRGSLLVTGLLAQRSALAPIAVLATVRDEDDLGAATRVLAALPTAQGLPLGGLSAADVAALMTRTTGAPTDQELAESLRARTGGNPFFVQQTAALWQTGSPIAVLPPRVRAVLQRRLARLPSAVHDLLLVAATWGTRFDIDLVAATAQLSREAATDLLTEASDAGLVLLPGREHPPAAAFCHDLLRECLVASLPGERSRQLHADAVRAVSADNRLAALVPPAQLAEHAHRAGSHLTMAEAVPILVAAGRSEAARLAAEDASVHFERALQLLGDTGPEAGAGSGTDRGPGADPDAGAATGADAVPDAADVRDETTLALGIQVGRAGHVDRAVATLEALCERARQARNTSLLARAALARHELGHPIEARATGPLDEVLALVRADPDLSGTALAARLMAAASRDEAHSIGAPRARAEQLSAQALAIARSLSDDQALGLCLAARHDAIWALGSVEERLALTAEMVEVGRRSRDRELALLGTHLRVVALLELGDPQALIEHRAGTQEAEGLALPRQRYAALTRQGAIEAMCGRFEAARASIDEARALGSMMAEPNSRGTWLDQVWHLSRLTGDEAELDDLVAELRRHGEPHVEVIAATVALDRGDTRTALRAREGLLALAGVWPRWAASVWLTLRAELAIASGDRDECQQVRTSLEPWLGRWAVLGGAVLIGGPLALWAGKLDAALCRWDDAIARFEQAAEAAERLSARPWHVFATLDLVAALAGRRSDGDLTRAIQLLDRAADEAASLGLGRAVTRAEGLRATLSSDGLLGGPLAGNAFHRDGAVWTLRFRGRTTHLPDTKGIRDLHALIEHPGVGIAAAELADPSGGPERRAADRLGADPVLDEAARRAYRRRLEQLAEAIDEAVLGGDDEVAARLDRERGILIDELARATGLGGRSRRLGDSSERARKAVSARIRDAIRRIAEQDPDLGTHLEESVSTGTVCAYRPVTDQVWRS